jgi:hypothetical protein
MAPKAKRPGPEGPGRSLMILDSVLPVSAYSAGGSTMAMSAVTTNSPFLYW